MNVTLTIGERDFSSRLSIYKVEKKLEYDSVITTMDGVEHFAYPRKRYTITFMPIPFNTLVAAADYAELATGVVTVTFTDPDVGTNPVVRSCRVASDLNTVFGIDSVDGYVYYKRGEIVLRAIGCEI